MLGVAAGLLDPAVLSGLCGKVTFMAVPAEEGIEIEYRISLKRAGKIEFLNGKPEFIRLGVMDGVDMAMMMHTSSSEPGGFGFYRTNGNLKKAIEFIGKAAHAGSRPDLGINALNAATLALSAIHFQRETFRDADSVRVHPIITRGGAAASSVPADVRMETFVRASNVEALRDADRKVDRSLRAGALAVGASVRVVTSPGPLPSNWNAELEQLWTANAEALTGAGTVHPTRALGGSTDMADISHLVPAIHPFAHAATGSGHGVDYEVRDYDLAVITAAKAMGMTVIDLLANSGALGRKIIASFTPSYTKDGYLAMLRGLAADRTFSE
jgi:amidohydrolase